MAISVTATEGREQSRKTRLLRFASPEWLVDSLERHSWRWVLAFLAIFMAFSAVKSAQRLLWFDEIQTFYIAQQPSVGEVIRAIREGSDTAPPLYALLVKNVQALLGPGELGVRLPSLVGFCAMCICVFTFARRRMSPLYAALAMLVAASGAIRFATEGRPYGLVLGCVGLAIAGLALSLAVGTAAHYYTVFVLVPLFAGEIARWWARRKFDLAIFIALTTPLFVLLAHWPLIEAARVFVPYYFSKVRWQSPADAYEYFFSRVVIIGLPIGLACFIVFRMFSRGKADRERRLGNPTLLPHESVAAIVLALLPISVVVTAWLTTRVFFPRYVMSMVIGVAILTPVAIHKLTRGSRLLALSALAALLAFIGGKVIHGLERPRDTEGAWMLDGDLAVHPPGNLPVVITQHHAYLEVWFYGGEELRKRLVHVNDAEMDRRYLGQDSDALNLGALSRRVPLRVPGYHAFLAGTPHFLLVTDGQDWLPAQLLKSGYRLRSIHGTSAAGIFEVQFP